MMNKREKAKILRNMSKEEKNTNFRKVFLKSIVLLCNEYSLNPTDIFEIDNIKNILNHMLRRLPEKVTKTSVSEGKKDRAHVVSVESIENKILEETIKTNGNLTIEILENIAPKFWEIYLLSPEEHTNFDTKGILPEMIEYKVK
jgi:hypothetical protein